MKGPGICSDLAVGKDELRVVADQFQIYSYFLRMRIKQGKREILDVPSAVRSPDGPRAHMVEPKIRAILTKIGGSDGCLSSWRLSGLIGGV